MQHLIRYYSAATLLLCGLMVLAGNLAADDQDPAKQAAISVDQADADFPFQGEYSGEIDTDDGKLKYGVQVIALGNGKFRGVGYHGGLPGEGWNQEAKVETEAEKNDGVVIFKGEQAQGILKKGALDIQSFEGNSLGILKKVERKSRTLGKKAPDGAVVLFDGTSADNFQNGKMTDDGLLMQGVTSHQKFGSFTLHLEFMLSYMPHARQQGRSNSGCYLQGRHEVQILDSFGLSGEDNECGGIYGVRKPDLNMCYPPLAWQTYDVEYRAAKFDQNGKKTANARMTVFHNGVIIHKDVEVPEATRAAPLSEGPTPGPIYLQDHSNPLRFRNIWLVKTEK